MALRTTLEQLVEMVRDETKVSSNSSRGSDHLAYIQRLIKRHYETLCDAFEWSFLTVHRGDAQVSLEAGQRYYDWPIEMDTKDTMKAHHFYGNVWVPLEYGIDYANYNQMNPDMNQRADPQMRWQIRDERQFEVWPLPASNGNLVEFTGTRRPTKLVANSDRADMDDQLIVLMTAAEILEAQKPGNGAVKAAAASSRLAAMREKYGGGRRRVRMGMGTQEPSRRPADYILAYRASN
jgi:hypothetical protein